MLVGHTLDSCAAVGMLGDDRRSRQHTTLRVANDTGNFPGNFLGHAEFFGGGLDHRGGSGERLRHDLDEDEVGMAILVHHSFPDEEEHIVAFLDQVYYRFSAKGPRAP